MPRPIPEGIDQSLQGISLESATFCCLRLPIARLPVSSWRTAREVAMRWLLVIGSNAGVDTGRCRSVTLQYSLGDRHLPLPAPVSTPPGGQESTQ